jgi:hypothetical protein
VNFLSATIFTLLNIQYLIAALRPPKIDLGEHRS